MGILDRDRKILWARAHNSCAYCKRPLVEDATADDGESVVGDEAHIVAQSGNGPRAGFITDTGVDSYDNLILLCKVHHKLVDDQPATYTVERLRAMKRDHERCADEKIRAETGTAIPAPEVAPKHPPADDDAPEIFSHVPETSDEIHYVLGHRPWSWEYLLYAGALQVGLREAKLRGAARRSTPVVFRDKRAAVKHISVLMDELQSLVEGMEACFEPALLSKALGEPGRPGEFRLIDDMARRLVGIYRGCSEWSFSVRTAVVPRQVRTLFEIVSRMSDRPMADIELYAGRLVAQLNQAINRASEGGTDPMVLMLVCEIAADQEVVDEFSKEMRRVQRWW